jgi:hypothetical protein
MSPYGDQPLLSREALREHFSGAGPRVAGVVRYQPDNVRIHGNGPGRALSRLTGAARSTLVLRACQRSAIGTYWTPRPPV